MHYVTHSRCCLILFIGSKNSCPIPRRLLGTIADWLTVDPRLCLIALSQQLSTHRTNLWTSPTKSNTQTPTPGLVRWCVKAPLIYELASRKTDDNDKLQQNAAELELIWSKLHLAVLETMLHLRTLPDASQLELLTMVDMNRAVKELVDLYGQVQNLGQITEDSLAQIGVDRLAQCLQISLSTGAFRCSMADLRKILQSLPPSP